MALKNFDLKEIIYSHCEDPKPNSKWADWWAGKEPSVPAYWAHLVYWSISEAESYFARIDNFNEETGITKINYLPQYDIIKLGEDIAIQRVEADQIELIKRFDELNIFDGQTILQPFEFESLFYDDETLRTKKYHQCMAIYSIYCADLAISGLLNNDSKLAATATSYALQSADMTYDDALQNHFADYKQPISAATNARNAARARYSNDPKQRAKLFIRECWCDWQKNPERYSKQSDFVIDVLSKIDTNENGEPIISFDTVLKKWIPIWTKEKK